MPGCRCRGRNYAIIIRECCFYLVCPLLSDRGEERWFRKALFSKRHWAGSMLVTAFSRFPPVSFCSPRRALGQVSNIPWQVSSRTHSDGSRRHSLILSQRIPLLLARRGSCHNIRVLFNRERVPNAFWGVAFEEPGISKIGRQSDNLLLLGNPFYNLTG